MASENKYSEEKEQCIKFYLEVFRKYIASNLDHKDLLFYEHFDRDARRKYRELGKTKGNDPSVVLEMIDDILGMESVPGRFTALVEGKCLEDNPKVLSILKGTRLPLNVEESRKRMKQLGQKDICKDLDVEVVLPYLERHSVINGDDRESILNTLRNRSKFEASIDLIHAIGDRKENWFVIFMMCLIKTDQKAIAVKVDPDLCEALERRIQEEKHHLNTKELKLEDENRITDELGKDYSSLAPQTISAGAVSGRPNYLYPPIKEKDSPIKDNEYDIDETGHKVVVQTEQTVPKQVKEDKNSMGTMEADVKYDYHEPSLQKNNLSPNKPDDGTDSISSERQSVTRSLVLNDVPEPSLRFDSLLHDTENVRVADTSLTDRKAMVAPDRHNLPDFSYTSSSSSSSGDSSLQSFDAFLTRIDGSSRRDNTSVAPSLSENGSLDASLTDTYLDKRNESWKNSEPSEVKLKTDFSDIQQITTVQEATKLSVVPQQGFKQTMDLRENWSDCQAKQMKDKDVNVRFEDQRNITQDDDTVDEIDTSDPDIPDVDISLRKYQEELAKPALKGHNVIIVAPTGSGKTRVAMRIIQEHIRQQKGRGVAKVIFLVNQVALANQQGEACRELLKKYSCEVITGESQRKMKCLKDFINKRDILVVTAQVLLDAIIKKEISGVSCFSLIVFDECHHTYANHTFNAIMGRYMDLKFHKKDDMLPQIVGLTASVGVGKSRTVEKAVNHIKHLMANLDAEEISTVNDNITELREHVSLPEEETVKVPRRENDGFGEALRRLMDTIENRMNRSSLLKEIPEAPKMEAVMKPPAQKGTVQYTQWVNRLWKEMVKIKSPDAKRFLNPCRQHLDLYNNALIIYNDARMEDALNYLDHEMKVWKEDAVPDDNESILYNAFTKLRKHPFRKCPNPKLDKLRDMVMRTFHGANSDDSRGIVFVKTRDLAKAIMNWMKGEPVLRELKPIQFVGQNVKADRGGMTKVEQEDALKYFRDGKHKLIIATSVAEEGLDISKCNLVIRYDHVTNEIAMVQSRGRGRAADSKYCVIAEESTGMAEKEELNMIREVMMSKAIIQLQRYIREKPEEFKKEIHDYQDEANLDRELKNLGKKRKVVRTGQFELRCLRCDQFICWSDDIKKIEDAHHVVIDQTFEERVSLSKSGHSGYQNEAIQFVGKVICRNCGANLGTICIHREIEFPVLKIAQFLIVDTNGRQDTCKKWKSVPFHVANLSRDDWRDILAIYKDREGVIDE